MRLKNQMFESEFKSLFDIRNIYSENINSNIYSIVEFVTNYNFLIGKDELLKGDGGSGLLSICADDSMAQLNGNTFLCMKRMLDKGEQDARDVRDYLIKEITELKSKIEGVKSRHILHSHNDIYFQQLYNAGKRSGQIPQVSQLNISPYLSVAKSRKSNVLPNSTSTNTSQALSNPWQSNTVGKSRSNQQETPMSVIVEQKDINIIFQLERNDRDIQVHMRTTTIDTLVSIMYFFVDVATIEKFFEKEESYVEMSKLNEFDTMALEYLSGTELTEFEKESTINS